MKTKIFYVLSIFNALFFCAYLVSFSPQKSISINGFEDKILKVRGLVVVDSSGIERVIVGAHLPEPNWSYGYRTAARGKSGSISGVMLYDHEGQERGGYVTDDDYGNAFLTLDSKTQQNMLLIAEPQGGATFQLWDRGNNQVRLGAYEDDAVIKLTRNNKNVKLYDNEK